MQIPIASITRYRETLIEEKVQKFFALLQSNKRLPPIVVKPFQGGFLIHEGSHRLRAAEQIGQTHIEAELIDAPAEIS